MNLVTLTLTAHRQLERLLEVESGLPLQQYAALCLISERSSVHVSDLKGPLQISQGTVSELVTRLERKELVAKERDPKDSRAVKVTLTAKGRYVLKKHQELLERRLAELPAGAQEALSALLAVIAPKTSEAV